MIWLWWLASRAGVLYLVSSFGRHQEVSVLADVRLYTEWFAKDLSHGRIPSSDAMWNYPPGAGLTLWAAGLIAPYVLGFIVLMLAADAAIMRTIVKRAPDRAGPWLWVLAPLMLGPVMVTRFDLIPTLLAVVGVGAGPVAAGFLLCSGAWVKMWPVAILAVRLAMATASQRARMALGALIASAGAAALVAVTGQWSSLTGWLSGNGARGLQIESVAAAPWLVARTLGLHVAARYDHGSVQLYGPGTAAAATLCSVLGLVVLVVGVYLARHSRETATVCAAMVLCITVSTKVLSPQYLLWSIGLLALTRSRKAMALLAAACLLTQLVYPTTYLSFVAGAPAPSMTIVLRDLLVVACAVVVTRDAVRLTSRARLSEEAAQAAELRNMLESRAASVSHRHSLSAHARPAMPIPLARSASDSRSATAAAIWASDRPDTTRPVVPSMTASGAPPESPETTGSPQADASR